MNPANNFAFNFTTPSHLESSKFDVYDIPSLHWWKQTLHQAPFTPDNFYKHLLTPDTPNTFYTKATFTPKTCSHQKPFTPDTVCTRQLLQTPFYTRSILHYSNFYTKHFTPDTFHTIFSTRHLLLQTHLTPDTFYTKHLFTEAFYTRHLLHQTPFTPKTCSHQKPFTPDTFYTRQLLHQTPVYTKATFTSDTFHTNHLYTRRLLHTRNSWEG